MGGLLKKCVGCGKLTHKYLGDRGFSPKTFEKNDVETPATTHDLLDSAWA